MMASGVGWRAMAALSGATLCTCERLSRAGSAWLPRRGVHALHTVFLFRLSPKADKNQSVIGQTTVMHRVWTYFHARLAFTMAAFNVLVQWQGFQPYASGFVPLSIAEFSL